MLISSVFVVVCMIADYPSSTGHENGRVRADIPHVSGVAARPSSTPVEDKKGDDGGREPGGSEVVNAAAKEMEAIASLTIANGLSYKHFMEGYKYLSESEWINAHTWDFMNDAIRKEAEYARKTYILRVVIPRRIRQLRFDENRKWFANPLNKFGNLMEDDNYVAITSGKTINRLVVLLSHTSIPPGSLTLKSEDDVLDEADIKNLNITARSKPIALFFPRLFSLKEARRWPAVLLDKEYDEMRTACLKLIDSIERQDEVPDKDFPKLRAMQKTIEHLRLQMRLMLADISRKSINTETLIDHTPEEKGVIKQRLADAKVFLTDEMTFLHRLQDAVLGYPILLAYKMAYENPRRASHLMEFLLGHGLELNPASTFAEKQSYRNIHDKFLAITLQAMIENARRKQWKK